jgi:hypothetical protein
LGDVPWWLGGVHLGWDSWVHERDVLVAVGGAPVADEAETVPVLAYGLVLASFFIGREPLSVRIGPVRLRRGSGLTEAWAVGDEGDEAGDEIEVVGDPVATVDALSGRGSLPDTLEGPPEVVHRLGGMARYFNPDA